MTALFLADMSGVLLGWLMGALSLFLVLLVLVQRGRGGGLTGALGGAGGQSAFGSKAGDTFTLITVIVAAVWGFTCAFTMWLKGAHTPDLAVNDQTTIGAPVDEEAIDTLTIPTDGGIGSLDGLNGLEDAVPSTTDTELTPADGSLSSTEDEMDLGDEPSETVDEPTETEMEIPEAEVESTENE